MPKSYAAKFKRSSVRWNTYWISRYDQVLPTGTAFHETDPDRWTVGEWIQRTDAVKIHLLDSASGATRELVSVMPEQVARRGFAVSPDDRDIYFSVSITEADVWKIEFER
jgi:hypothetical protein